MLFLLMMPKGEKNIGYQRNVGIKGCLREFKGEDGIGGEEGV